MDRLIKSQYPIFDTVSTGVDDKLKVYITNVELCDSVRSFIASKTQINLAAITVEYIEKIPRSESGKVLYTEISSK